VIVTTQVQRQIAGLFVAEERGTHNLKGVPEPTTLFRLVRASGGGRRAGQRLQPLRYMRWVTHPTSIAENM
jgi:class 3 adenylate cyclase